MWTGGQLFPSLRAHCQDTRNISYNLVDEGRNLRLYRQNLFSKIRKKWVLKFLLSIKSISSNRKFLLPLPGSGVVGGSGVDKGLNWVLVVNLLVVEAGLWVVLICLGLFFRNPSLVLFSSVDEGTIFDEPLQISIKIYNISIE